MRFVVYDIDDANKINDLSKHDLIGQIKM